MNHRSALHSILFVGLLAPIGCAEVNQGVNRFEFAVMHADDPKQLSTLILGCFALCFITSLIFAETNSFKNDIANAVRYTSVGALLSSPFYWWYTHNLQATFMLLATCVLGACAFSLLRKR